MQFAVSCEHLSTARLLTTSDRQRSTFTCCSWSCLFFRIFARGRVLPVVFSLPTTEAQVEREGHIRFEARTTLSIEVDKYFGDIDELMKDKGTKCESASSSTGDYIKSNGADLDSQDFVPRGGRHKCITEA